MATVINISAAVVAFVVLTSTQGFVSGMPGHYGHPPNVITQNNREQPATDERENVSRALPPQVKQPIQVGQPQSREEKGAAWQYLSLHPVCFHAKGNRPGEFTWVGGAVHVGALALVHKSGFVRCTSGEEHNSYWGCYQYRNVYRNPLNVVVTDLRGNVIFPQQMYIKNRGLWYYLPATDPLHSKVLMFSNFENPLYLRTNERLRIWYGEDLRNWRDADNSGRVCVDVVGYVMPTFLI